jgi:serine protease Do
MKFKTLILLLALWFTPAFAFHDPPSVDHNALVERARDAVLMVSGVDAEGKGGFGSGFLISGDGLFVTNYHVIHRAVTIRCWFYDEEDPKNYIAEIVGIDPAADLAVLKLKLKEGMEPLTHLSIEGDLEDIKVGEPVIAIGHLLGLDWTVTMGNVSHINRPNYISPYVKMVQHTAPINRGNSGGPVINAEGKVIGVNTTVRLMANNTVGVAYAVRGDILNETVLKLINGEEIKRAGMGVKLRQLSEFSIEKLSKLAKDILVPNVFGAMVVEIEEDSHPYKQGLRNFDVIIAVDGVPTNGSGSVASELFDNSVGDVVKLIVIRDSMFIVIPYSLKEMEFDYMAFYDKRVEQEETQKENPDEYPDEDDE